MSTSAHAITRCLQRWRDGDPVAVHEMLPLVYEQLRALAGSLMRGDRPDHTLQPTALVHEAWLKIANAMGGGASVRDREHFLAIAAKAMRQVLVNHARGRRMQKREAGGVRVPLDAIVEAIEATTGEVTVWNELLEQLAVEHPRPAEIVELRVFGGLLVEEVAEVLGLGTTTVKADWRFARAWLQQKQESGGS
ncbi:MAG: RNA polymerase subunit sigma-70 [Planctomycetes bacterium]|nr:RNA polymerase subunit sigma-70 [Planctomycetota bacterium]